MKIAYEAGVDLNLEQRGILQKITYRGGTSAGALISASATTLDAKRFCDFLSSLKKSSDVFEFSLFKGKGLYRLKAVKEFLEQLVDEDNPNNIEAESCCVDLGHRDHSIIYASNREMDFKTYLNYTLCSATIPGLMEPNLEPGFEEIFDGGIREYIPIRRAMEKCERVIAVATSPLTYDHIKIIRPKWIPEILWWLYITLDGAMQEEIKVTDFLKDCELAHESQLFVISPKKALNIGMFEVNPDKISQIMEQGFEDAEKVAIPL